MMHQVHFPLPQANPSPHGSSACVLCVLTTLGVSFSAGSGVSTVSVDSDGKSAVGTPSPSHPENRLPEQAKNVDSRERGRCISYAIVRIAVCDLQRWDSDGKCNFSGKKEEEIKICFPNLFFAQPLAYLTQAMVAVMSTSNIALLLSLKNLSLGIYR